ncbi:hypothetical protein Q9R32_05495 [Actinotalea sp. AC32]|nr:hypothetical protein [Actinotalea sp. AC32]
MERSDDVLPRARAVLTAERARLAVLGVPGELRLTGGSSVPGTVTRGDVDLHLRVAAEDLAAVVATLRGVYVVVHPEIWQATLVTFEVPDTPLPTGVAVTPVGSEHDVRFTRTWARLGADPALLAEYTALKAGDAAGYEARKSAFFDRLARP